MACAAASTSNARSLRASQVVALGALELLDDLAAFGEKAPRFLSPEAVLTRGALEPLGEGATMGLPLSGADRTMFGPEPDDRFDLALADTDQLKQLASIGQVDSNPVRHRTSSIGRMSAGQTHVAHVL